MNIWIAKELNLYKWIDNARKHYIPITIESIVWDMNDDECPYCGSRLCYSGCQDITMPIELGFTNVTFRGRFPEATKHIFNLPVGTTLDAVRIFTGTRANNYEDHHGGLRFIIRKVIKRTIPCFMARTPDENGMLFLDTIARCKIELLFREETKE